MKIAFSTTGPTQLDVFYFVSEHNGYRHTAQPRNILQTVLDAVNRQGQKIEAKVDVKISEKIGQLRDEIHGTNQCMKSHLKKTKSDSQYKRRSVGNNIQCYGNNENLEDLTQALWALDNSKTDYARDLIIATIDLNIVTNSLK